MTSDGEDLYQETIEFRQAISLGKKEGDPSYAVCIGDIDGDRRLDIALTNHINQVGIWLSQPDGTFHRASSSLYRQVQVPKDSHGCAFADIGGEAGQDLMIVTGAGGGRGGGSNALIRMTGNAEFMDLAQQLGVDYPAGRARSATWGDFDGDGGLDLLLANAQRPDGKAPTAIFQGTGAEFEQTDWIPEELANQHWLTGVPLTSGNVDTRRLVLVAEWASFPLNMSEDGARLSGEPISHSHARDFAVGDFNNDLASDLIVIRKDDRNSEIRSMPDGEVRAALGPRRGTESLVFRADGPVSATLHSHRFNNPKGLFTGDGTHVREHTIVLDPDNTRYSVNLTDEYRLPDTEQEGVYVGYDLARQIWAIDVVAVGRRFPVNISLQSEGPIEVIVPEQTGITERVALPPRLIEDAGGRFHDGGAPVAEPLSCNGITAGDFDNDMDIDLVMVCASLTGNRSARLYLNDGTARFKLASRELIPPIGDGTADKVVSADLNQSGFLDLVVTNGYGMGPWRGATQVLFNQGNANNWLQMDLKGGAGNRDGIGAVVVVDAGGVRQMREQWGGVHIGAQEPSRIHFGLGSNNVADRVEIRWPDGSTQILRGLRANRIHEISKP